jgi:uncharacterized membrane protein YcaP (DUF421 family)
MHELVITALRALGVYALMLVVIRALGKRTVGNFAAFDLLVALMLGEVVDEIIYGDVTFSQGTAAIVAIAAAQFGNSWLSARGADRILEGSPTVIIRDGRFDDESLKKADERARCDGPSARRRHRRPPRSAPRHRRRRRQGERPPA